MNRQYSSPVSWEDVQTRSDDEKGARFGHLALDRVDPLLGHVVPEEDDVGHHDTFVAARTRWDDEGFHQFLKLTKGHCSGINVNECTWENDSTKKEVVWAKMKDRKYRSWITTSNNNFPIKVVLTKLHDGLGLPVFLYDLTTKADKSWSSLNLWYMSHRENEFQECYRPQYFI